MNVKHLQNIIKKHFPDARMINVTRLTGGVSADVYRLDLALATGENKSVVIRIQGVNHSGHPAETEFSLLEALARTSLPVPKPLVVDTSRECLEHDCVIIEFAKGNTVIEAHQLVSTVDLMAGMLARIHEVPVDGLPPLPTRTDPLPELFDFLPEDSEWDSLRGVLAALEGTGYTGAPRLLHGDYWPENLLWLDGKINAVLDWEDAAVGDPLSDVACCRLELRYKFGRPVMDQFSAAYANETPIDTTRLALWQIYVAAAAQKYMGNWGLDPALEAHMRAEAYKCIRESGLALTNMDK